MVWRVWKCNAMSGKHGCYSWKKGTRFSRTDIFCQFQKNIGADDSDCLHGDDIVDNDDNFDGDVFFDNINIDK